MLLWCLLSKRLDVDTIKTGYLISSGPVLYAILPGESNDYIVEPYCYNEKVEVKRGVFKTLSESVQFISMSRDIRTFEVIDNKIVLNERVGLTLSNIPIITDSLLNTRDNVLDVLKSWYICEKGNYHYIVECNEMGVYYKKLVTYEVLQYDRGAFYNVMYSSRSFYFRNLATRKEYEGMPLPRVMNIPIMPRVEGEVKVDELNWVQRISKKITDNTQFKGDSIYSVFYMNMGVGRNEIKKHDMRYIKKGNAVLNIMGVGTDRQLFDRFGKIDICPLYLKYSELNRVDFEKSCTDYVNSLLSLDNVAYEIAINKFVALFNLMVKDSQLKSRKGTYILFNNKPFYVCSFKDFCDLCTDFISRRNLLYKRLFRFGLIGTIRAESGTLITENEYKHGMHDFIYTSGDLSRDIQAINMLMPRVKMGSCSGEVCRYTESLGTLLDMLLKYEKQKLNNREMERFYKVMLCMGVSRDELQDYFIDKSVIRRHICQWYEAQIEDNIAKLKGGQNILSTMLFDFYVKLLIAISNTLYYFTRDELEQGIVKEKNTMYFEIAKSLYLLETNDNRVTYIGKKLAGYVETQCYNYIESVLLEVLGEDLTEYALSVYPLNIAYIIALCIRYTVLNIPRRYNGRNKEGLELVGEDMFRLKSPIPMVEIPAILSENVERLRSIDNGRLEGIDIKAALSELLSLYLINVVR